VLIERGALDDARENLEAIGALTDRMGKITNQLKLFVGRAQTHNARSNLARALRNALQLLQKRLQSVSFEVRTRETLALTDAQSEPASSEASDYRPLDLAAEHPSLVGYCDDLRLEQALINLIGNALDALESVDTPRLLIDVDVAGDAFAVIVRDNGPGIPAEVLPRLFEPFFTTKETGKGLGLGLAIASTIARDCGGSLSAYNRPSGGAAFVLTLRRAATAASAVATASNAASSP
jgi:two-component system C4-dicarboxylate transport sensor histidine kinase DctB